MGDEITKLEQKHTKLKHKITSLALGLKAQKYDSKVKISALKKEISDLKHPRHEDFVEKLAKEEMPNDKATDNWLGYELLNAKYLSIRIEESFRKSWTTNRPSLCSC